MEKIDKFTKPEKVVVRQVEYGVGHRVDLRQVLTVLARDAGVTSLLVEGGATIHGAFLRQKLVDHVNLFIAPIFAGSQGVSVVEGIHIAGQEDAVWLQNVHYCRLGQDMMVEGDIV